MIVKRAPLAVLPGLMCDGSAFPGMQSAFPSIHLIDDFYGNCDSLEAMAEHALFRLPPRFASMGHSMGARIALEIYRVAPQRVTWLAFVSTGIHEVRQGEAQKRHALLNLGKEHGIDALCDAWLPPMLASESLKDPVRVHSLKLMIRDAGVDTYARQIKALLHRREVTSVLYAINVPTLAMVGDVDAWSPISQHQGYCQLCFGVSPLRYQKCRAHASIRHEKRISLVCLKMVS